MARAASLDTWAPSIAPVMAAVLANESDMRVFTKRTTLSRSRGPRAGVHTRASKIEQILPFSRVGPKQTQTKIRLMPQHDTLTTLDYCEHDTRAHQSNSRCDDATVDLTNAVVPNLLQMVCYRANQLYITSSMMFSRS